MRIACVHVPQFALQCVTRVDPSLRGAPIAVVGAGVDPVAGTVSRIALHSPVVLACSRAAWALGVRIGMTATAARSSSPELAVISADATLERDTARAIADVLLGASSTVDLGGRVGPAGAHLALYCEVPSKTRGTTFGDRIVERLSSLGLTARIGIADDRFTAWVAASQTATLTARVTDPARTSAASTASASSASASDHEDGSVVSVPRGGSAAFLAPRPLSLLSITPEVQHMLEALGVTTLGEFAALPPPSVHLSAAGFRSARPLEADYQALARGDSGTALRPYAPDGAIAEQATISDAVSAPAAIALIAERIAMRLAGRSRAATRLELHATLAHEPTARIVPTTCLRDGKLLDSADDLADAIGKALGDSLGAMLKLRVVVTGEGLPGESLESSLDAVESLGSREVAEISAAVHAAAARVANVIDPLGVVLSNTGTGAWQLTSPSLRDERRDAHRRTQRGKERRTRARVQQSLVQPRLFKTLV